MIRTDRPADTDRFRSGIARCLGLHFDDGRMGFLADVLRRRLDATRQQCPNAYLARLEADVSSGEVAALAQELTVAETYFFRNRDQYRAVAEVALPYRLTARSAGRRLRVLSAGCASGEEAYSLAILLRDAVDPSWDVSILGVDASPANVSRATEARYSSWALRETPADVRQRWFRVVGRDFVLDDAVRKAVKFEIRNLVRDDPQLWQPETYDLVFFRNVLMYFTPESARTTVARIARALVPGGYLFLGDAETLRGLSDDFYLRHSHGTFYYQRKERLTPRSPSVDISQKSMPPVAAATGAAADSWVDAIRRAADRIQTLTDSSRTRQPGTPRRWSLERSLELLGEERFTEALESMAQLPPEAGRDPDALLLRAALQTHRGQLIEAEAACQRVIDIVDSPGAHYLMALCREGAGDASGAMHHARVAISLDPNFAMPRLHLGLRARRAGDRAGARRELERALTLLGHEDGSRLLLFGGGFGREALVALCRTELVSCGGEA